MRQFLVSHWTGVIVTITILAWAVFYLPRTPQFAMLELKHAVDNREGSTAIQFVNFESVVKHAGDELAAEKGAGQNGAFGEMIGKGAIAMFAKPIARFAETYVEQKVNEGAREVQIPSAAVIGTMFLMHRSGGQATTTFKDRKGKVWRIEMSRSHDGRWQITEVKNIRQLIENLHAEHRDSGSENPIWQ